MEIKWKRTRKFKKKLVLDLRFLGLYSVGAKKTNVISESTGGTLDQNYTTNPRLALGFGSRGIRVEG